MRRPRRQHGVALIIALLVTALAVILAAAVLDIAHHNTRRTSTLQDAELSWGYATGVEDWVRTLLMRDAEDNEHDSLDEFWAQPQTLPIERGSVSGELVDAQGRFNLNNLGLAQHTPAGGTQGDVQTPFDIQARIFEGLIRNIEGGTDLVPNPRELAESIRDWIDADTQPTGSGREDGDYALLDPPRRAANRPMVSTTELRNVLEVLYGRDDKRASKIYRLLEPYVIALPVDGVTPININTAVEPLLLATDLAGDNARIRQYLELRLEQPITEQQDIITSLELTASGIHPALLSVSTSLFLLRAAAAVDSGHVALYSLIYRPKSGLPMVLWRSTDSP